MESQVVEMDATGWQLGDARSEWIDALEAGKVLYFPKLSFSLLEREHALLKPELLSADTRSITLDPQGRLKGVQEDSTLQETTREMIGRFRQQANELIHSLAPAYRSMLQPGTTSYRPLQVETRKQSWRADDRRLHVDAFAGKPNHGKRILRVFSNINPAGVPRVWRVGEPFETVARRFLPRMKPYSRLEAWWLRATYKTKPVRSEYDHLMLQLHDCMKLDLDYQQTASQVTCPFAAGSTWVCFSDQTSHAAMSGQYMLEQTFNLPASALYRVESSPLSILSKLTGRALV
ncbi:MAG TPA: Kdo hydroxylase family protein [Noviherbaspirillum sp.]|nr:Kdo hydroxylase family protein [Noviherbaspirillum sp.]